MLSLLKKLVGWRKSILDDRIESLKLYREYRKELHEEADNLGIEDPLFGGYLRLRKFADSWVYGSWLKFLKLRRSVLSVLPFN